MNCFINADLVSSELYSFCCSVSHLVSSEQNVQHKHGILVLIMHLIDYFVMLFLSNKSDSLIFANVAVKRKRCRHIVKNKQVMQ